VLFHVIIVFEFCKHGLKFTSVSYWGSTPHKLTADRLWRRVPKSKYNIQIFHL